MLLQAVHLSPPTRIGAEVLSHMHMQYLHYLGESSTTLPLTLPRGFQRVLGGVSRTAV